MNNVLVFLSILVFLLVLALFYMQMQKPPVIIRPASRPEVYIERKPEVYVVGTEYWPSSYWNWWGGYHPGFSGPSPYWGMRTRPGRGYGHGRGGRH